MQTKVRNFVMSSLIAVIYFLGVLKIPYYLNRFFKGTYVGNNIVGVLLTANFIFAILLFVFLKKVNINSISKNVDKEDFKKVVLLAVVSGVLVFVGGKFTDYVLKLFKYVVIDDTIRIRNILENNNLMFFYMVLAVPVVQELVYRNVIFGNLYDIYEGGYECVRFLTPAFLTGVIFCIFSSSLTLPTFVKVIYTSSVLSFVYYKTKRIETSILANVVYNLCVILFALFTKPTSVL